MTRSPSKVEEASIHIEPYHICLLCLLDWDQCSSSKTQGKKGFESIFDPFSVLKLVFEERVKSPGMLEDVPHRSKFHL
ncbi:hypothetical protein V6N13_001198 [Hibiscus sabdariffa]